MRDVFNIVLIYPEWYVNKWFNWYILVTHLYASINWTITDLYNGRLWSKVSQISADYSQSDSKVKSSSDVIMTTMASQITSLAVVYSTVHSGADQRKHQSSASYGLCAGNTPMTGEFPAQRESNAEMFPFDDVIMSFGPPAVWIRIMLKRKHI